MQKLRSLQSWKLFLLSRASKARCFCSPFLWHVGESAAFFEKLPASKSQSSQPSLVKELASNTPDFEAHAWLKLLL